MSNFNLDGLDSLLEVGGAVAGSGVLSAIPGVGPLASTAIGGTLGLINSFKDDIAAKERFRKTNLLNRNMNNTPTGTLELPQMKFGGKKSYSKGGGMLKQYVGPSHEQGGINVDATGNFSGKPVAEVEGGETAKDGYVFSNSLISPNGKTYAEESKNIDKKYGKKRDWLSKSSREAEFKKLQKQNDLMREAIKGRSESFTRQLNDGGPIDPDDPNNVWNINNTLQDIGFNPISADPLIGDQNNMPGGNNLGEQDMQQLRSSSYGPGGSNLANMLQKFQSVPNNTKANSTLQFPNRDDVYSQMTDELQTPDLNPQTTTSLKGNPQDLNRLDDLVQMSEGRFTANKKIKAMNALMDGMDLKTALAESGDLNKEADKLGASEDQELTSDPKKQTNKKNARKNKKNARKAEKILKELKESYFKDSKSKDSKSKTEESTDKNLSALYGELSEGDKQQIAGNYTAPLYNLIKGMTNEAEVVPEQANREADKALNILGALRATPDYNPLHAQANANQQMINQNATGNRRLAALLAGDSQQQLALGQLATQNANQNNSFQANYAGQLLNQGERDRSERVRVDNTNAQNRAAKENFISAGVGQLGTAISSGGSAKNSALQRAIMVNALNDTSANMIIGPDGSIKFDRTSTTAASTREKGNKSKDDKSSTYSSDPVDYEYSEDDPILKGMGVTVTPNKKKIIVNGEEVDVSKLSPTAMKFLQVYRGLDLSKK